MRQFRNNPRLRVGIYMILMIGLLYALLMAGDWQNRLEADFVEKSVRLARLEAVAGQSRWPTIASAARASVVQTEILLWKANSPGLAKASVQNWMNRQLKKNGIDTARVNIEDAFEVKDCQGIWQVSATLEIPFLPKEFLAFIAMIEKERGIVVEQLDISRSKRSKLGLGLKIYFKASAS